VIDMALTVRRALGDTGAGPSVITTKLLELLPADACVKRDLNAMPLPASGPDERLLVQHGTAMIIFQLAGVACSHRFMVIEGEPMLLLGNDFLCARKAVLSLNADEMGSALIVLTSRQTGGKLFEQPCKHQSNLLRERRRPYARKPLMGRL